MLVKNWRQFLIYAKDQVKVHFLYKVFVDHFPQGVYFPPMQYSTSLQTETIITLYFLLNSALLWFFFFPTTSVFCSYYNYFAFEWGYAGTFIIFVGQWLF